MILFKTVNTFEYSYVMLSTLIPPLLSGHLFFRSLSSYDVFLFYNLAIFSFGSLSSCVIFLFYNLAIFYFRSLSSCDVFLYYKLYFLSMFSCGVFLFIIWPSFPFAVCPRAVYSYDNSSNTCYRIVDHLFLNWTAAEDFCQKDGAHLISLRTENQTNFISEQLKINCTYIIHCPNVVYCMV